MARDSDEYPDTWGDARTAFVEIKEHHPRPGRVTIVAWTDGALNSRTFEMSLRAFVVACNAFADRIDAKKGSTSGSQTATKEKPAEAAV